MSRLKSLHTMRSSKGLNRTLVNSLSNHLEDILAGSFQTLSLTVNSQVYARVYQKLNQVAEKIKQT